MPDTWKYWSKQALGYVAVITDINERYVALYKIQYHLNEGYSESQVAKIWNQGHAGPCKAGINSKGVAYDSCSYERKVLAAL